MRTAMRLPLIVLVFAALLFAGCQKEQRGPAPLPQLKIGVTGFTQPTTTVDLMAGYIPEGQHMVGPEKMFDLSKTFAEELQTQTKRTYTFVQQGAQDIDTSTHKPGQGQALAYWVEVGRTAGVDLLVVPQVIDLVERDGGDAGVVTPASVVLDFYLIDIREGSLVARSRFDERQTGLAENMLDMPKFLMRRGKWLTALDLSREGMRKAIKEFGL